MRQAFLVGLYMPIDSNSSRSYGVIKWFLQSTNIKYVTYSGLAKMTTILENTYMRLYLAILNNKTHSYSVLLIKLSFRCSSVFSNRILSFKTSSFRLYACKIYFSHYSIWNAMHLTSIAYTILSLYRIGIYGVIQYSHIEMYAHNILIWSISKTSLYHEQFLQNTYEDTKTYLGQLMFDFHYYQTV